MRSMEITDEWLYQHMPVVDNAMITALENQVFHDTKDPARGCYAV